MRALVLLAIVVLLPAGPGSVATAPAEPGAPGPTGSSGGPPDGAVWIWSGGDPARATAWLSQAGVAWHLYPRLDMVAFEAPHAVAEGLVAHLGGHLTVNERMDLHLDQTVAYIEADRVKDRLGIRRDGPTVLVVDTGVDSSHPDFQAGTNLVANAQTERTGGLVTGVVQQAPVVDLAGHGTHVAGIAGGLGEGLGPSDPNHGRYEGVYSIGRIAGFQAATVPDGQGIKVDTVGALEAFDWALANRERYDIRVVTNSWGTAGDFADTHAVNEATLRLYLNGIVVVFSAGNDGETQRGVLNKYCMAPWVLCVAAGDLAGGRAPFSSTGDPNGAPFEHPDLTAPGFGVESANPPIRSDPVGGILAGAPTDALYATRSGTSMAAPHVAGVAGLIQTANPTLSPDQVMDILVSTTDPMLEPVHEAGAGYLNARQAYNLAVQTAGNRGAFLSGAEVKYAGAASGDPDLERDPVSVGYNSAYRPGPVLAPAAGQPWLVSAPIVFAALLAVGLGAAALGIRWR